VAICSAQVRTATAGCMLGGGGVHCPAHTAHTPSAISQRSKVCTCQHSNACHSNQQVLGGQQTCWHEATCHQVGGSCIRQLHKLLFYCQQLSDCCGVFMLATTRLKV
jgi:hypothetical protein